MTDDCTLFLTLGRVELFWVELGLVEFELFWVKLGLGAGCGLKCGLGTRSLEEILRLLVEVVTVRFVFVGLSGMVGGRW